MAAPGDNAAPVIIKRKKIVKAEGHHGGAWKVAYADFVTAMMAFFLLMWLLNATTEKQRKGIADYFSPTIPINRISGGGDDDFGGESLFSEDTLAHNGIGGSDETVSDARRNRGEIGMSERDVTGAASESEATAGSDNLGAVEELLMAKAGESEIASEVLRHIRTRVTDEGLIIELFDLDGAPLFVDETDVPAPVLKELAALVASASALVRNAVAVEAHTRARPVVAADSPVWDLSASRANAMRRLLEQGGLQPARLRRVTGHADREPVASNPFASRNNRLEVILLRSDTAGDRRGG